MALAQHKTLDSSVDFATLMPANMSDVFGERDGQKRMAAIKRLYATDAVLNEPERTVKGHEDISAAVSDLLAGIPSHFWFFALSKAHGHHGIGVFQWGLGPSLDSLVVTGMDVAHFQNGVIHSLTVFLNPPNGA
jgi:hypothetical protein